MDVLKERTSKWLKGKKEKKKEKNTHTSTDNKGLLSRDVSFLFWEDNVN